MSAHAATARPPLVVHVINRLAMGGLENGVVNLVNRMPPDDFEHAIVSLTDVTDFAKRITREGVQVHALGKRPGTDLGVHGRFWRLMRRLRPALVHTRNVAALEFQWTARLAGVRAGVHGEHGWDASDPTGQNPRHRWLRRVSRPVVDRFVPMSKDLERWLIDVIGVRPSQISQLYNGVDTGRFAPGGPRVAWGGVGDKPPPDGTLVVGTIGRLDPIKNQRLLIEALAALDARAPTVARSVRLAIVGDGPRRSELEKAVTASGVADRTWLAGSREDVADLLRGFDVFVLPSLNEGISNTVLEAMATGLPVVATRVGGNPELVVDGSTGALVPSGDALALAATIERYAADQALRSAHGRAGRARAEATFSLGSMVKGYLGVYRDALGTGR